MTVPEPATAIAAPTMTALRPTVFHEDWWLDAVTGGAWQTLTVSEGGREVARWPIYPARRWRMPIIELPPLTYSLGPALDEGKGSNNTRMLRRLDLTQALIEQLPRVDHIGLCLHHGIGDVIAFQAHDFDTAVQFTVTIAPAAEETLWRGLRDKTRNVIRRCQEKHTVVALDDPERFVRFYLDNLAAQDKQNYFPLERVNALYASGAPRGQVQLIGVQDAQRQLVGATLMVNDAARSYHLLSTRKPDRQDNGLTSLMIWEALRQCSAAGRIFDFDGMAAFGSARFYAGFGGVTAPRYIVRRSTLRFRLLQRLRWRLKGNDRNYFQLSF